MSRISALSRSQRTAMNHPSWEKDEDAKRAHGQVIAKWLDTGVLEYVAWNDRMLVLLQPCGAVPKGTVPFYHRITDVRVANELYFDGGLYTPQLLSSAAPSIVVTSTSPLTFRTPTTSRCGQDAASSYGRPCDRSSRARVRPPARVRSRGSTLWSTGATRRHAVGAVTKI